MKVLWIVNSTLGVISEKLCGKRSDGLWMSALLRDFENHKDIELVVATTYRIDKTICEKENGVTFYALPNEYPLLYDENDSANIACWRELLVNEKPNVIQVWGTEFTHGLCALRIAKQLNIPSVIYMQGYLGSIARHYLGGIEEREIKRNITFRDIVKRDSILNQQRKYYKRALKEKEMFMLSGNIISENKWCFNSVKAIVPTIKNYDLPLSINRVFGEQEWSIDKAEQHTLICTASGYPLKGLHMVLKAVGLLKNKYPDIKLLVPGPKQISDGSLQWFIRKNGYTKYIERLIKELNIEDNIEWLGQISQKGLAETYTKARAFVLSSSIENHSSSLKEAMLVGVPCVASAVGGVPEYVSSGENGFLYRFNEYEIMAHYIDELFNSDELATKLSLNARRDMLNLHMNNDMFKDTISIYNDILGK